MHDPPPADLPAGDQGEVLGPLQELHDAVHVLLLHEREAPAVQRREGAPGRELRHRQAGPGHGCSAVGCSSPAATSCRPASPATRRSTRARGATRRASRTSTRPRQLLKESKLQRREDHGLGQQRGPDEEGHRGLRPDAQRDRLQGRAQDHRRRRLLRHDGQREDEGADRLRQLVRRLPEPGELHVPGERQVDPADEQPEPRQRRRPRAHRQDHRARAEPRPGLGGRRVGRRPTGP